MNFFLTDKNRQILKDLFRSFAKVGFFTIGGGYAMLPMLEQEIVKKHRWASLADLNDIFAMAQTVPGAIAINTATAIGKRQAGIPGAIAATAGIITPSFFVILVIAIGLQNIVDKPLVTRGMQGVRGTVAGLIAAVSFAAAGRTCKTSTAQLLTAATVVLALFSKMSVIAIILCAIAGGALHYFIRHKLRL